MHKKVSGTWFKSQLFHWLVVWPWISRPMLFLCPPPPHLFYRSTVRLSPFMLGKTKETRKNIQHYTDFKHCCGWDPSFHLESQEEKWKKDLYIIWSAGSCLSSPHIQNITEITIMKPLLPTAKEQPQHTGYPSKISLQANGSKRMPRLPNNGIHKGTADYDHIISQMPMKELVILQVQRSTFFTDPNCFIFQTLFGKVHFPSQPINCKLI